MLASCGSSSADAETAKFGEGDVGILNYALLIEQIEAALYADIVDAELAQAGEQTTMRDLQAQEQEHVGALIAAVQRLGGKPTGKPATRFGLENLGAALATAEGLENLGAAAYLGQLAKIESASAKKTVLSIYSVEGRHAAAIALLRGRPTTPEGPLAKPATVRTVLKSIEPFLAG